MMIMRSYAMKVKVVVSEESRSHDTMKGLISGISCSTNMSCVSIMKVALDIRLKESFQISSKELQ